MRMVIERDAEHIARLALVPVGGLPYGRDGGYVGVVARQTGLDHHIVTLVKRQQLIDHFDPVAGSEAWRSASVAREPGGPA